jgi:hypothetical protein
VGGRMNMYGELERIRKKVAVAYLKANPEIFLE